MIEYFLYFVFGVCIGSFANVCIYRLPLNKNLLFPFSYCPHCNTQIKFYHNIPIISYLFLKCVSSCCNNKISIRYPIVETFIGISFIFIYHIYSENTYNVIFISLLILGIVIIFFTDLEHFIIPNQISYTLSFLAIILSLLNLHPFIKSFYEVLIGGMVSGLILYITAKLYLILRKKEGMGMGDVKMITMIGLWLGLQNTIIIIVLSSIIGALLGIILILLKKIKNDQLIPFGSFLSISTLIIIIMSSFYDLNLFFFYLKNMSP